MGVAFDNKYGTYYEPGSTEISFSFTMNGNTNMALVVEVWHSYATITSISYAGTSLGSSKMTMDAMQFYCKEFGSTTGSNTFSYTQDSGSQVNFHLSSWSGVDQTTPSTGWAWDTNYGSSPASPSITCPTNGMVVGCGFNGGYGYGSAGSGNTLLEEVNGYTNSAASYRSSTGTVAVAMDGASTWYHGGGALNAAAHAAMRRPPIIVQDAVHRAANW